MSFFVDTYVVEPSASVEKVVKEVFVTNKNFPGQTTYQAVLLKDPSSKDGGKIVLLRSEMGSGGPTMFLSVKSFFDSEKIDIGTFLIGQLSPPKIFLGSDGTFRDLLDALDEIKTGIDPSKRLLGLGEVLTVFPDTFTNAEIRTLVSQSSEDMKRWALAMSFVRKTTVPECVASIAKKPFLGDFLKKFNRYPWPHDLVVDGKRYNEIEAGRPAEVVFANQNIPLFGGIPWGDAKSAFVSSIEETKYVINIAWDNRPDHWGIKLSTIYNNPTFHSVKNNYEFEVNASSAMHRLCTPKSLKTRRSFCRQKNVNIDRFAAAEYLITNGKFNLSDRDCETIINIVENTRSLSWEKETFIANGKNYNLVIGIITRSRDNSTQTLPSRGTFVVAIGEEIDGQYVYRVPSERYLMGGPKAVTETAIKKTLAHQKERKKDDNERSL